MLALTFEVTPRPGHLDHYFKRAAVLKPLLAQHDELLHLERYTQLADPNIVLSHQYWRDEDALVGWRKDATHYRAQVAGRDEHFADYRICVAEVLAHRADRATFEVAIAKASPATERLQVIVEGNGTIDAPDTQRFTSVVRPGCMIALHRPASADDLTQLATHYQDTDVTRTLTRITRDYTMRERAEAPQDF